MVLGKFWLEPLFLLLVLNKPNTNSLRFDVQAKSRYSNGQSVEFAYPWLVLEFLWQSEPLSCCALSCLGSRNPTTTLQQAHGHCLTLKNRKRRHKERSRAVPKNLPTRKWLRARDWQPSPVQHATQLEVSISLLRVGITGS